MKNKKDVVQCLCLMLLYLATAHGQECTDPGEPSDGTRYISGLDVGDVVVYTCDTGYEMTTGGDTMAMECLPTNHWNASLPYCNKITCGDPGSTVNTTYSGAWMYADVVEYVCVDGFRMPDWSKKLRTTCQADKTWDPTPVGCVRIQCIEPEVIPFANRTTALVAPYWLNSILTYECEFGYRPRDSADLILTCGDRGFWDGTWPECLRIRCGDPGMVDNAGRVVTGNGAGTVLIYSCNRGYMHDPNSGPLNRTCQENAEWTGSGQPACLGLYCGPPIEVAHAIFTPDPPTYRFPETLRYTCDPGFRANYTIGIDEITCTWQGGWDFKPLTCERIRCIETSMSENTVINNEYYYYNDTKIMECLTGYEITNGSLVRTCEASGYFSDSPPLCTKVQCPDPAVDSHYNQNVTITGDGNLYRQIVTLTCATGYEITGGQSLTFRQSAICQADRRWEPELPVCSRLSCGVPDLRLNVQMESYEGHYYSDTVTYNCTYGYERDRGNQTSTCQENRRWSGDTFQCIEKSCTTLPTLENGVRIGTNFRYKGQISFTCNTGYELIGNQTIKCQADGTWTDSQPTCNRISCGMPENLTQYHVDLLTNTANTTEFLYGQLISYTCAFGHYWRISSGSLNRTCSNNGRWSDRRPICDPYVCGDPGEVDGTYKLGIKFTYGQKVNYTCATGYEAESGQSWGAIRCEANLEWSGTKPTCNKIYCGDPGPGSNATRDVTGTYHYGDTIRYHCFDGHYYPDGRYLLRCLETKNWSAPAVHCALSPIFNPVSQPEIINTAPAEAEGATMYGYIGVALMGGEVLAIIILDLATLQKEINLLKRNLNCKKKKKKVEVPPEEPKVEMDPFTKKASMGMKFRNMGAQALMAQRMANKMAPMQTRNQVPPPYTKGNGNLTPVEAFGMSQNPPPYSGMNMSAIEMLRMRAMKARAMQQGKLRNAKEPTQPEPSAPPPAPAAAAAFGGMSIRTAALMRMRAQNARKGHKKTTPPPPYDSKPQSSSNSHKDRHDDEDDDEWNRPRRKTEGKRKISMA